MNSGKGHAAYAMVADYVPRRCGIATFTADLTEAIAQQLGDDADVFAMAVNDVPEGYDYPGRVRFEIRQNVQADYRLAAEFLNVHQVSAVCVQHEFGIYGGPCGTHALAMMRRIRRPLVTTCHTVLKTPDESQRQVMRQIGELSDRMVVMSEIAREFLRDIYAVPAEKIAVIPHGIPDVPFLDPNYFKDQFGCEGRRVMLTFGLLSPGKGIETVIEALPQIVRRHNDVLYIVLGATHPHVKRESGEEYRNSLFRRAEELGVSDHIQFQNRFVELRELLEFLCMADLYVTPYLGEGQVTSGTLAYAMGAGKAVISTPYWHAREVLADGRGRLVPFQDAAAIARETIDLLDNEVERHAIRKRAYTYCRSMIWSSVAQQYLDLFGQAREAWAQRHVSVVAVPGRTAERTDELPEIDLRHLHTLTDSTGILQHAVFSTPNRDHGYCTDDNARALIVATEYWDQTRDGGIIPLMQRYLAFLFHAMDEKTGRFRNFMKYDRNWSEVIGSEDSHARALWGLGMGVAICPYESMVTLCTRLFLRGLSAMEHFTSPRSWSFAICGIHAYLRRFSGDSEVRRARQMLVDRLVERFRDNMTDPWPWCESTVTYDNAKLPHALLMSGKWMGRGELIDLGLRSLDWLLREQTGPTGMLTIIGTDGWHARDGRRAQFDQQPIEAHALVDACIEAWHVTRETRWIEQARKSFHWFLGDNDLRTPLYDFTTGGCRDGLEVDTVNENQGAESTLAWLMSLLLMHDLQTELALGAAAAEHPAEQKPAPRAIKPSGPVLGART
jgi:glycosyltransferase involved in cell wall biosynthesis